ncbi:uncharacterized protein LOC8275316 isoform X2 [Ricinus communis]|uniref:Uncharacterized protein n=1 Tax=Ricinus communis TaxID=3988 RepID=B9RYJ5_RICCO|nr:uncharacterized protein LOC8275316 isoform X2 [Ricinus communis]EEF43704.1 hypothetical protein RCOM_0813700 [Ricinus communis]|eukprot:XP_002518779.1 uncharacterized protein LOC8275316 isoform X2 [Ricinus communis]
MDPGITCWILEFLARQPISQLLLNKILTNTHIPIASINNPRFKKALLLRSIHDEIANGSASSETILQSLETIEELDNTHIADSMKLAYQAVAVDCTLKWVIEKHDKGQFFKAVKRIWRGRIERLESLKKSELVTDELKEIKQEIEAALWDSNARKRLLDRNIKSESLRLVKDYLNEALDKRGPSFLELAAKVETEMKEKQKGAVQVGLESAVVDGPAGRESLKNDMPDTFCQRPGGIKDTERAHMNILSFKYNPLLTPEVTKVKEALKSSSLELKALVEDPLPNALHLSEALIAEEKRKALAKETAVKTWSGKGVDVPNPSISPVISQAAKRILNPVPSAEELNLPVTQTMKTNTMISVSSHQNIDPKRSLMDCNSTARTFEWDDSIDGSPEETANPISRFELNGPRRKAVSSLKNNITKFARRRKIKRWSVEEEDALRESVQRFGRGNWKLILNSKRHIFVDRTEVDLKDKWRNMTR